MKLKHYQRNSIMDSLYNEESSIKDVKQQFVLGYRMPARKAKRLAEELLQEGIEYWLYDSEFDWDDNHNWGDDEWED